MDEIERLRSARAAILDRIAEAARRAGRDPGSIEVVAVTKTVAADRIRAAMAAGFTTFAENRVQERATKAADIDGGRWHLVGPLQSNKARRAIELFDVIETVDSLDLAQRLSRIANETRPGAPMGVLLQVNVDDDPAKAGFEQGDLSRELPTILELSGIRVDGLMTVGRLVTSAELARPTFVALGGLSERLRAVHPGLGPELSMGMSDDYAIAVEEGATIVRIGRAIFGARLAVA